MNENMKWKIKGARRDWDVKLEGTLSVDEWNMIINMIYGEWDYEEYKEEVNYALEKLCPTLHIPKSNEIIN